MLLVDLVRHRVGAGLVWGEEFYQSFYIFYDFKYIVIIYITRLFDNYNSIYNYGFWIIIEVIKVLKFPAFLRK